MKGFEVKDRAVIPYWEFSGGEVSETVLIKDLVTQEMLFKGSGTKFPDEIRIENVAIGALRFVDFRAATTLMMTNVRPLEDTELLKGQESTYLEFTRSS